MIYLTRKYTKACLASLVSLAISLPMLAMSAVAPTVTVLPPFNAGDRPISIALAADGSIFAGNYSGGAINQLDPTGKFIKTVNKEKIYSNAIAFAQDGTLLVATSKTVTRLALDGVVLGALPFEFKNARSMATDDLGFIYVVDSVGAEVVVFSPNYQFVKRFGSKGSALGQFVDPGNITFDKVNRQLLVADTLNNRVQVFDLNGNALKAFGTAAAVMGRPTLPMEFHSPQSVAIEYTKSAPYLVNRLYVVDTMQSLVQVIDASSITPLIFPGKTTNFIAGPTGTLGIPSVDLSNPLHAVFDQENGRLLVANVNRISVFGIDGGGNPVDVTAPSLWVVPPYTTIEVPRLPITGTVEAGSTVTVTFPGVVEPIEYFATMNGITNWRTVASPLVPGKNTFSVIAKDAAGNETPAQTFSIDYVLPAPAVTVSALPVVTNVASLVVSGKVDAGATVKVKNSATQIEGDAVVAGSDWTYSVALAEGINTLTVSAKAANTKISVVDATVSLDATAPVLAVSALSNASVTSAQVQNISGTVADAGQVAVLVNNSPVNVIAGAFSTAVTLSEGQNQILVIAADAAGNTVQDVRTVVFDGTKPVISIAESTLPDNTITNSELYTISGTVSETAQITVAGAPVIVDSANGWSTVLNLVPGDNTIEVVATDVVGNTSSVKRTVTYAAGKVDLAISVPAQDYATNKKHVKFNGSVTDNAAIELSYAVNGGASIPVVASGGTYRFTVDFKSEGTYSVAITAKDASGLSTTSVRTIIFDKTAPLFKIDKKSSSSKVLRGTVEPGATITDIFNRPVSGLVVTGTEWTLVVKNARSFGNLILKATDAAGNVSILK